jgi:hypothetical protein
MKLKLKSSILISGQPYIKIAPLEKFEVLSLKMRCGEINTNIKL